MLVFLVVPFLSRVKAPTSENGAKTRVNHAHIFDTRTRALPTGGFAVRRFWELVFYVVAYYDANWHDTLSARITVSLDFYTIKNFHSHTVFAPNALNNTYLFEEV